MSKKNFKAILMALVAMSFFKSPLYAQDVSRVFTPKIKTPQTKKELINDEKAPNKKDEVDASEEAPKSSGTTSSAQRRVQQHGLGLGIGETFLLGNYAKYGNDKITADLLYSYAASYSFDLLVNAHMSEHKDNNERMKLLGLTTSIKGRVIEFDNFSPYVLGGLGFYAPKAKRNSDDGAKWTDQKLTFGLNFGGGIDLRLNDHYVVGVLGQMHWPFTVKEDNQSDLKGYYFKLLITGMYLF
ncbi:MAG: outer membrane protein [Bacteriovoracaceae bacterium]